MSVRTYLEKLRNWVDTRALATSPKFVSGNQSADLDSVISAISYSFFNNLHHGEFTIPLVNIPRQDIQLRRDIVSLLDSQSISCDLLYFLEDFHRLTNGTDTVDLVLVDHCNLQGPDLISKYQQGNLRVSAIIDHHADEGVFADACPRIITPSGSCSSLVFNYWFDQLNNDMKLLAEHTSVVDLLIGPLVIDTSNMTQKVEASDSEAFKVYETVIGGISADSVLESWNKQIYSTLKKAKKDLSGFTLEQVLRKDYKQFQFAKGDIVGFSSMSKSFSWVLKTYDPEQVTQTFRTMLESLGLTLLVLTPSFTDKKTNQYTRQLIYVYFDNKYDDLGSQLLVLEPEHTAEAEKFENKLSGSKLKIKVFNQKNINASRKQVVPAVKEALEK